MKTQVVIATILSMSMIQVNAQNVEVPQIGGEAPSFTAESTNGTIQFPGDYGENWKILFCHPKDFTPVCSSEILELAHSQQSFEDLNTKLVVLSTDILNQHRNWKAALEEVRYKGREPVTIEFPLVADQDFLVSKQYGMIHTASSLSKNIRGVYIIDPENTIRSIQFYPNEVGRNVEEIQRTLEALQATYAHQDRYTPANWKLGDDMLVPVVSTEEREKISEPGSDLYQYDWFLIFDKMEQQ